MLAAGFVAARFRHRTSRAGDPHLHWHVLVANMAQGIDGRWSALDGTALYAAKRTAGVMFQTAMRRELTARLGVEWGPTAPRRRRDRRRPGPTAARVLPSHRTDRRVDGHPRSRGSAGQGRGACSPPADPKRSRRPATRSRPTGSPEHDALGWGPAELETLLAAAPGPWRRPAGTWVDQDVPGAAGEPTTTTRRSTSTTWLDWLLDYPADRPRGDVHPLRADPGDRRRRPASTPRPRRRPLVATVHRALAPEVVARSATTGRNGRASTRSEPDARRRPGAAVHRPVPDPSRAPAARHNSARASTPASALSTRHTS